MHFTRGGQLLVYLGEDWFSVTGPGIIIEEGWKLKKKLCVLLPAVNIPVNAPTIRQANGLSKSRCLYKPDN